MKQYRRYFLFLSVLITFFLFPAFIKCLALPVTSPFGWRSDPISGEWKFHSGLDLGYEEGTGIPALFSGLVIQSGDYADGYGNQVLLYHQEADTFTRYGHCADIYVIAGEFVVKGQIIAAVGSTGRSTGPHLHLEYIVKGINGYEYTNPAILWGYSGAGQ